MEEESRRRCAWIRRRQHDPLMTLLAACRWGEP